MQANCSYGEIDRDSFKMEENQCYGELSPQNGNQTVHDNSKNHVCVG